LASGVAVVVAAALMPGIVPDRAYAYTAAGDRLFPATLVLPQIAPGDEIYFNEFSLPLSGGHTGAPSHANDLTVTYLKTITDRLGIVIDETWTRLDLSGGGAAYGWQNHDIAVKYLAILDQPHEFLFTLGLDREVGGTGALRAGASPSSATTPTVFFGKGLGDLDIGYLRPLAIAGLAGYQIADRAPRPDLVTSGLVVEYSFPYLQSKVQSLDLPEFFRGLTPMTEISFTAPGGGRSFGARTTALIAPGVSYAGAGWEIAVEALVPASRATGRGIGVTAQFHLSLDYLAGDTIGRPLFAGP
jgi:hypothetical protein